MMESIKKLREALKDCTNKAGVEPNQFDTYWITAAACDKYIDAIEREIADRYMQSPVDDDGKLWSMEDKTFVDDLGDVYQLYAIAWVPPVHQWYLLDQDKRFFLAKECRHVKERTVEDVLVCFLSSCGDDDPHFYDEEIREYADELREMLGGDAE